MPRNGFIVTEGRVERRAGRAFCVKLVNGHDVYARFSSMNGGLCRIEIGDTVRLEVPVADPSKGFLVGKLVSHESQTISKAAL